MSRKFNIEIQKEIGRLVRLGMIAEKQNHYGLRRECDLAQKVLKWVLSEGKNKKPYRILNADYGYRL